MPSSSYGSHENNPKDWADEGQELLIDHHHNILNPLCVLSDHKPTIMTDISDDTWVPLGTSPPKKPKARWETVSRRAFRSAGVFSTLGCTPTRPVESVVAHPAIDDMVAEMRLHKGRRQRPLQTSPLSIQVNF